MYACAWKDFLGALVCCIFILLSRILTSQRLSWTILDYILIFARDLCQGRETKLTGNMEIFVYLPVAWECRRAHFWRNYKWRTPRSVKKWAALYWPLKHPSWSPSRCGWGLSASRAYSFLGLPPYRMPSGPRLEDISAYFNLYSFNGALR